MGHIDGTFPPSADAEPKQLADCDAVDRLGRGIISQFVIIDIHQEMHDPQATLEMWDYFRHRYLQPSYA